MRIEKKTMKYFELTSKRERLGKKGNAFLESVPLNNVALVEEMCYFQLLSSWCQISAARTTIDAGEKHGFAVNYSS